MEGTIQTKQTQVVLVHDKIVAKVNWSVEDDLLPMLPCFELSAAGMHTLKTSVFMTSGDLRSLAEMLTRAADEYEADRAVEEAEIKRKKNEADEQA